MRTIFLRCECDANATTFQNPYANAMRMRICRIASHRIRIMRKSQCEFISLPTSSLLPDFWQQRKAMIEMEKMRHSEELVDQIISGLVPAHGTGGGRELTIKC